MGSVNPSLCTSICSPSRAVLHCSTTCSTVSGSIPHFTQCVWMPGSKCLRKFLVGSIPALASANSELPRSLLYIHALLPDGLVCVLYIVRLLFFVIFSCKRFPAVNDTRFSTSELKRLSRGSPRTVRCTRMSPHWYNVLSSSTLRYQCVLHMIVSIIVSIARGHLCCGIVLILPWYLILLCASRFSNVLHCSSLSRNSEATGCPGIPKAHLAASLWCLSITLLVFLDIVVTAFPYVILGTATAFQCTRDISNLLKAQSDCA
jgi:hypothetical protein